MIFVDADAFIGVSVKTDPHHEKSKNIFDSIKNKKETLVTSWDVVDEVASKVSQFATKKASLKFLELLNKSQIKVFFVDEFMVKDVIELFVKQTSKRVSLTDCSNMVIAKSLGITVFFSFDEHYEKNGFNLLSEEN